MISVTPFAKHLRTQTNLTTTPQNTDETQGETTGEPSDGNNATDATQPTANTNTGQNVQTQNDPKKNKKLAELKMSEPMRELLNFELVLPGVYPGIKTNQFIWIPVKKDFYDEMYSDILMQIGPSKFNRYSDFEEGRFYISQRKWEYDIENGVKTSLTVNPIPSMYSEYMKMQLEAERALDQAIIDASSGGGGGGSLVEAAGSDNTDTLSIATTDHNGAAAAAAKIIGNSSANYAQDTAGMNLQQLAQIPHKYSYYANNRVGPQKMWQLYQQRGWLCGNCADLSRMFKCLCDVHGIKCAIYHGPNHYWNLVDVGGGVFKDLDWCTNNATISGSYSGGYQTNSSGLAQGSKKGSCNGQENG